MGSDSIASVLPVIQTQSREAPLIGCEGMSHFHVLGPIGARAANAIPDKSGLATHQLSP
jgi:hypothetical protein